MAEIKVKPKGTIKKLEKEIVQVQKFKNNLITVKEKVNEFPTNDNNTAENYASQKIQNDISYISRKGAVEVNEIGKKSLKETQENFIKRKQKIEILKSKIKETLPLLTVLLSFQYPSTHCANGPTLSPHTGTSFFHRYKVMDKNGHG